MGPGNKKKGNKSVLSPEVERSIRENFDAWVRDPSLREAYRRDNIGKKQEKIAAADKLWDELVRDAERQAAQAREEAKAREDAQVKQGDVKTTPNEPTTTNDTTPIEDPIPPKKMKRPEETAHVAQVAPTQQTNDSPVGDKGVSPNDGGTVANSASTAQGNSQTGVPNASIRDLPPIDWSGHPPSMPAPSDHEYHAGSHFGSLTGVISNLKNVGKDPRYPIRTELRSIHDTKERVLTNHFEIRVNPNTKFYEYQITGMPASAKRNLRKRLMMTVIEDVSFLQNKKDKFATDYFETIISWEDLHSSAPGQEITTRDDNNPDLFREWRLLDVNDRDGTINLNLRFMGEVDIAAFRAFTGRNSPNGDRYNPEPVRRALHIMMTKCIRDSTVVHLNANKFFFKAGYMDLCKGKNPLATLHALRGYHYKIKAGMGKILLNMTSVTSAFWNPSRVSDVLREGLGAIDDNMNSMKGLKVFIEYQRGKKGRGAKDGKNGKAVGSDKTVAVAAGNDKQNKDKDDGKPDETINDEHSRVKRICGFGKAVNEQKFQWTPRDENGDPMMPVEISVADYLFRTYGRTLSHPDLAAVNLGTEFEPSWFAPEHLTIVPYQIYARVIPEAMATTFHGISCKMPQSSRACIEQEGIRQFSPKPKSDSVNEAGVREAILRHCDQIKLSPFMLDIPRTQLPSVVVQYSNRTTTCSNQKGQWNLSGQKFLARSPLQRIRWKLLCEPSVIGEACDNFIHYFEDQLVTTGVCGPGEVTHLGNATPLSGPHKMDDRLNRALSDLHKTISRENLEDKKAAETGWIVVLLLNRNNQDVYSSFKYLTDKVYCLQSICATERNFKPRGGFKGGQQAMQQYMANVAMKANLKAAGINHSATGVSNWLKNTLVLGADLTHAGNSAIDNCPSISAVVSSVGSDGGWFIGQPFIQWDQRSEIVTNLETAVKGALDLWIRENGCWPENVLYYRDGVGDGQYEEIKTRENTAIQNAWNTRMREEESEEGLAPLKLTTVIVSKRHSTRFFPGKREDAMMKNENCMPGLLVDSAVTDPYYTDFYLQSHKALKGTARPCHYFLLNNGMQIGIKDLQDLTHRLCHTYVRSTTGVSYAPPAYYADRLCERGRCYLRKWLCPDPATRKYWDDKRKKTLADVKREQAEKNKKQAGGQQQDRKGKGKATDKQVVSKKKKSKAERDQEKKEKEELMVLVNKRLETELFADIDARWYVDPVDDEAKERKEWNQDTMYWM